MGRGKWKLSFRRSPLTSPSSPPPPPSSSSSSSIATREALMEFLCPISQSIMADPVIVSSGQTFERACIQACSDLAFFPPALNLSLSSSSPLVLIPNVALKAAIHSWCDRSCLPRPIPVSSDAARDIVRRYMDSIPSSPMTRAMTEDGMGNTNSGLFSSSSSVSYSSSYPSSEIETLNSESRKCPETQEAAADPLQDEILTKLMTSKPSEQEIAMVSLRQAARESRERRIALCTPRLLAALRPMLLSRHVGVQVNALAATVNLSLEPPNKVRIVRSGAVPALVEVLGGRGNSEARADAATVIFSLTVEGENRAAIGALGAIPPLFHVFTVTSEAFSARRDAGMALYYLSLIETNRSKIVRAVGAVKALMAVAKDEKEMRRMALMVVCNLAGSKEGRAALVDGGAVATVVEMMREENEKGKEKEEEYLVAALYGMSRGSMRFRGQAKAVGAEKELRRVAEEVGGGVGKEMARKTLSAMNREDDNDEEMEENMSIVSEGLVSYQRRHRDFGSGSGSSSNTTEF
ncbi:U-box domain-containing protein 39-like [Typha latifolia]|uniref:U-box domain-containing protein 39-like n=1 Tax=Typha latifolia TaxID=4733 RepID=UPI003C2ED018